MMTTIFILLIAFQVKHFLCDYPLQNAYMLDKYLSGKDWILPMVAHCTTVAIGSLAILLIMAPSLWYLAILDFCLHFVIDRTKAVFSTRSTSQPSFWWSLGLDQMAHHLCHYFYIYLILTKGTQS